MKFLKIAAAAAALVFASAAAQAATQQSTGNCTLSDITPNAVACIGPVTGNAQQYDPNANSLFNITGWQPIQSNANYQGGPTGSFTVVDHNYSVVAVLLKSGNQFAAYRLNDWFGGLLSFSTANGKGLSNYVVVGASPVPLPAAAWMLLAALGGLFLVKRRKPAAA